MVYAEDWKAVLWLHIKNTRDQKRKLLEETSKTEYVLARKENGEISDIVCVEDIEDIVVPNCGVELAQPNERLGRKCKVPKLVQNGRQAIQTLLEQGFQVNRVRLFNSLPKTLRNMNTNQDDLKSELDKFLSKIPDQPRLGGLVPEATCRLTARPSNSLLAWIQET